MNASKQPRIGGVSGRFGVGILYGHKVSFATRLKNGEISTFSKDIKVTQSKIFKIPIIRSLKVFIQIFLVFRLSRKNLVKLSKEKLIELHRIKRLIQGIAFIASFSTIIIALDFALYKLPYIIQVILYLASLYVLIKLFFLLIISEKSLYYHGAEHKVIKAFLNGENLTIESISHYSPIATRCGTNLIAFLIILNILIPGNFYDILINRFGIVTSELILLFGVLGIAYELFNLSSKYEHNRWIKAILNPISLIQKITTREPTIDELEVALAAIKAATDWQDTHIFDFFPRNFYINNTV